MARSAHGSKLRRQTRAAKTVRRSSRKTESIAWSPPALLYERTPGAAGAPLGLDGSPCKPRLTVPDASYRRHEPEQTALYRVVIGISCSRDAPGKGVEARLTGYTPHRGAENSAWIFIADRATWRSQRVEPLAMAGIPALLPAIS